MFFKGATPGRLAAFDGAEPFLRPAWARLVLALGLTRNKTAAPNRVGSPSSRSVAPERSLVFS